MTQLDEIGDPPSIGNQVTKKKPTISYMASTASQRQRQRLPLTGNSTSNKHQTPFRSKNTTEITKNQATSSLPNFKTSQPSSVTQSSIKPHLSGTSHRQTSTRSSKKSNINESKHNIHIPDDIIHLIAKFSDRNTLVTLMRVSTAAHDVVGPLLYKSIEINKTNVEKLFIGLPRTSRAAYMRQKRQRLLLETEAKDKTEVLFWPDIPLDSEVEDNTSKTRNTKKSIKSLSLAYRSTPATVKRKTGLLKHTLILKINCLVPTHLCQDIIDWSKKYGISPPYVLFSSVKKVIISDIAVRQWANRQDRIHVTFQRHAAALGPESSDDVFARFIRMIARPEHVCIKMPFYSRKYRDSYLRSRYISSDVGRVHPLDYHTYRFQQRYDIMTEDIGPNFIEHLKYNVSGSLRSFTAHNISNALTFRSIPNKLFLSPMIRPRQQCDEILALNQELRYLQLSCLAISLLVLDCSGILPDQNIQIYYTNGDMVNAEEPWRKVFSETDDGTTDSLRAKYTPEKCEMIRSKVEFFESGDGEEHMHCECCSSFQY